MTREQAQKLIETYCIDEAPTGAIERLLSLDVASPDVKYFESSDFNLPGDYVTISDKDENGNIAAMRQDALDKVIYGCEA